MRHPARRSRFYRDASRYCTRTADPSPPFRNGKGGSPHPEFPAGTLREAAREGRKAGLLPIAAAQAERATRRPRAKAPLLRDRTDIPHRAERLRGKQFPRSKRIGLPSSVPLRSARKAQYRNQSDSDAERRIRDRFLRIRSRSTPLPRGRGARRGCAPCLPTENRTFPRHSASARKSRRIPDSSRRRKNAEGSPHSGIRAKTRAVKMR